MISIYGLRNCDTCRKALKWLAAQDIEHQFYDVRKDGLTESDVARWIEELGWEALLNRRGTTWRGLAADEKDNIDGLSACRLMIEYPALIKRPIFELDGAVMVGFKDDQKSLLLKCSA